MFAKLKRKGRWFFLNALIAIGLFAGLNLGWNHGGPIWAGPILAVVALAAWTWNTIAHMKR